MMKNYKGKRIFGSSTDILINGYAKVSYSIIKRENLENPTMGKMKSLKCYS